MGNIILTIQEANALLQLIDIAVKAGGLQVAENASVLARKISESFPQNTQEEESSTETIVEGEIVK